MAHDLVFRVCLYPPSGTESAEAAYFLRTWSVLRSMRLRTPSGAFARTARRPDRIRPTGRSAQWAWTRSARRPTFPRLSWVRSTARTGALRQDASAVHFSSRPASPAQVRSAVRLDRVPHDGRLHVKEGLSACTNDRVGGATSTLGRYDPWTTWLAAASAVRSRRTRCGRGHGLDPRQAPPATLSANLNRVLMGTILRAGDLRSGVAYGLRLARSSSDGVTPGCHSPAGPNAAAPGGARRDRRRV
jgi:hypothetical protein